MSFQNDNLQRATAKNAVAAALSDTVDLPMPACCGLYVTVTGNVKFDVGPTTITLTAVPAFTRLPFMATRVWATGTTATVLACY